MPETIEREARIAEVLDRLADGELLSEIADDIGASRPTLFRWLHETPELSDVYARARADGLLARGERLSKKAARSVTRLPSGGLDAAEVAQLRLEVDTDKWLLARLLSKVFGDKTQTEHTGPNGGPVQVQEVRWTVVDPREP
jgi:DNA-binding phage protein